MKALNEIVVLLLESWNQQCKSAKTFLMQDLQTLFTPTEKLRPRTIPAMMFIAIIFFFLFIIFNFEISNSIFCFKIIYQQQLQKRPQNVILCYNIIFVSKKQTIYIINLCIKWKQIIEPRCQIINLHVYYNNYFLMN